VTIVEHKACRVCGGSLVDILSLGSQYLSNFLAPGQTDGLMAPLELALCGTCRLVQLKHTAPTDAMYQNYWYRSGTNQTMRQALSDIAEKAENLIDLAPGDTVLDIGCNDGTLLAAYQREGLHRIGFDPAVNLAPYSRRIAEHVVVGYFEAEVFLSDPALAPRRPKVVTSIAMFYDLEDPRRFVSDVKAVLNPEGLWVVQMSYLPSMLRQNEIGNICHEHLEYYSLHSFEYLLGLHDFEVVDLELNAINGGSFRAYVRNRGADPTCFGDATYRRLASDRVQSLRDEELRLGLDSPATYRDFAFRVHRIKSDVVHFVEGQVRAGKRVYVYGASTKGNTLLQYFGLDHSLITAAAERNPEKWGRVTVGTHIPIVSEEDARRANPEFFLVLPWHFLDEFMAREREYLRSGGRFIVPMPYFTLV
jgi:SAM-dependent methyltransferase